MFENRTRIIRNGLTIFLSSLITIGGIFLSSKFLDWEIKDVIDMDELLFLPSIIAFILVGAVIGWLAYFEDVKTIMWNFIGITLIFGLVFPIIVGILVAKEQLPQTSLANIILFPASWLAAYILYKSSDYFALNYGHKSKETQEDNQEFDEALERISDRLYAKTNNK